MNYDMSKTSPYTRASGNDLICGYRRFYIQNILDNVQSSRFTKNMQIKTQSESVSSIITALVGELEKRLAPEARGYEFVAEISDEGDRVSLTTPDGRSISGQQYMALASIILLKHMNCRNIVLPITAADVIRQMIVQGGGNIIDCPAFQQDLMHEILTRGCEEQFRLCFDGIYASVMLLDYLNCHHVSFETLIEKLPMICTEEADVECEPETQREIINALLKDYPQSEEVVSGALKIIVNDGAVLILPNKARHYVKIISEGINMEAAIELTADFKNKIKKLAK